MIKAEQCSANLDRSGRDDAHVVKIDRCYLRVVRCIRVQNRSTVAKVVQKHEYRIQLLH